MVSIGTFEWETIHRIKYMQNSDRFVLVTVTIITIFADLAIAVISGIIIAALVFAWQNAKVHARKYNKENQTIYEFEGPLFFGSVRSFFEQFNIEEDSQEIILDFKNARVMDISGVEAIDNITKKYQKNNKNLKIRHLSEDCKVTLKNAGPFCEYQLDDPSYKIVKDF
jgi:SulP family sulfate permease